MIVLIIMSITSCVKNNRGYSLTDAQLVDVLADIHILEFMMKRQDSLPPDSIKSIYYSDMETIYNLSVKEIFENIERLRNDPVKYNILYNELAKVMEEEMVNARKESVQSELKDIN